MSELKLTKAAFDDLVEIWSFIAADNELRADEIVRSIKQQYSRLPQYPLLGRERNDLCKGYRSLSCGKYSIFYKLVGAEVQIMRILHGARDVTRLLTDSND